MTFSSTWCQPQAGMWREKVMRGESLKERKHVKVGSEDRIWIENGGTHPGSSHKVISWDLFFLWTLLVGGMKTPHKRLGMFSFTDWNSGSRQGAGGFHCPYLRLTTMVGGIKCNNSMSAFFAVFNFVFMIVTGKKNNFGKVILVFIVRL